MMCFRPYLLIFFIFATVYLAACGQTGDLYLPENETQEAESKKEKSKN